MHTVSVNVGELLDFFDSNLEVRKHSSAIKAVVGEELLLALLCEYFRRTGALAEVSSRVCTTGKRRGNQLDAWVKVSRGGEVTHYQVEVKCWSAHGVGGASAYLPRDSDEQALAAYRLSAWRAYWNGNGFANPGLNKVLVPMQAPPEATVTIPLACLWAPLHPTGAAVCYFEEELRDQHFPQVAVFSASSFLRQIGGAEPSLRLPLPVTAERMSWFAKLFAFRDDA